MAWPGTPARANPLRSVRTCCSLPRVAEARHRDQAPAATLRGAIDARPAGGTNHLPWRNSQHIWGSVAFERGITFSINQIRATLGDDAAKPRFIETIPRRGYRFIAPMEYGGLGEPVDSASLTPIAARKRHCRNLLTSPRLPGEAPRREPHRHRHRCGPETRPPPRVHPEMWARSVRSFRSTWRISNERAAERITR
jgi:hypothetical protein